MPYKLDFVGGLFDWDVVEVNATDLLNALKTCWDAMGDIWITFGDFTFNLQDASISLLIASAIIEFFSKFVGMRVGVDMGDTRYID